MLFLLRELCLINKVTLKIIVIPDLPSFLKLSVKMQCMIIIGLKYEYV